MKICYALKSELESRGATVYLTRTDDQDMTRRNYNYSKQDDMYLRVLKIDEYKPDLFLSIHLNSSSSGAWGSQVFYYRKSQEGERLAKCIHAVSYTHLLVVDCKFFAEVLLLFHVKKYVFLFAQIAKSTIHHLQELLFHNNLEIQNV